MKKQTNKQKIIDLSHGENPKPFLPAVKAVREEAKKINYYPDAKRERLTNFISKTKKIDTKNIYISNGIAGAINIIIPMYADKKSEIILISPTYPVYKIAAKNLKYKIKEILLEKDFSLDVNKIIKSITKYTKFIVIVNPNNPTGNILISNKDLEKILKATKGFVIVDEAYFEFAEENSIKNKSALQLFKKYKNLIVFRSFSKAYGLAGLRIGYVFADKEVIQKIKEIGENGNIFKVNRLALSAAESVFQNKSLAKKYIKDFVDTKKEFEKQISKIEGIKVLESNTSFTLFKFDKPIKTIPEKLRKKGILIKPAGMYKNFPKDVLIFGVPRRNQIQYVYKSLKEILK